jgi:hypothetical protein
MIVHGLVCVYYRGRFAAAMRTTKSYPLGKGEGMGVLRFLWKPGNIERLREGLQYVVTPTLEGWAEIHKTPGLLLLRTSRGCSFYSTGAEDLLNIIAQATAKKYAAIEDELNFATSGRCDWAYIVDLDRNMFDVFGNEEKKREAPITTRFSDLGGDGDHVTVPALLQSFPFSRLPATEKEFKEVLDARIDMKMDWEYRDY